VALRLRWRKILRRPTAIRLPPPVQRGTLLRTDLPERALSPEHQDRLFNLPRITTVTRTSTLSYRSRAIMGGGRKASIVGFPLAWHAGRIGVNPPAIIAYAVELAVATDGPPLRAVVRRSLAKHPPCVFLAHFIRDAGRDRHTSIPVTKAQRVWLSGNA
jgi:hypothetical protein